MLHLEPDPYSSVSFQHKQLTSPPPSGSESLESRSMRRSGLDLTPVRWPRRLLRRHQRLCVFGFFFLIVLYCLWTPIHLYTTFLRLKADHYLFEHRYIPCGVLRKEPMLYIQDANHVQIVWEMNCGMKQKEISIAWYNTLSEDTVATVQPIEQNEHHTLYKATIGPLDQGPYTYRIVVQQAKENSEKHRGWWRTRRKQRVAQHTFEWHGTAVEPFRIAAMADNQFGLHTFISLISRMSTMKPRPQYLLHAGDAVQHFSSSREWETDFVAPLTYFGMGQTMPMIYAHGNHDYDPTHAYHYSRQSASGDPWYSFSLAGDAVWFCVLDSNIDVERQDSWLQAELSSERFRLAQFRIVVVHIPPFLEYWDPEAWFQKNEKSWGTFVRERYAPLFEKYGVDLVISGHQHNYERGQRNGVHYAIIGGAGGDLDFDRVADWGMYEAIALNFHFVMIDVLPPSQPGNPWQLAWDTFDLLGQKIDSMILKSKPPRSSVES